MKSDVQIAQEARLERIEAIAEKSDSTGMKLNPMDVIRPKCLWGLWSESERVLMAKLVLVTAINPTAAGEGKTTVTIGWVRP